MDCIRTHEKTDEELFLSTYNIDKYEKPSVTTDIVLFSLKTDRSDNYRKADNKKLSVLLIKRGEHPFMNHWALPGGFLKPGETVEECALREIREETNVTPEALIPAGIFILTFLLNVLCNTLITKIIIKKIATIKLTY